MYDRPQVRRLWASEQGLSLHPDGDQLRVELHDTSRSLPSREAPASDEETGRGLALVTAVSGSWISTPTPRGKAVCCEFTVTRADQQRWGHRIDRAAKVIEGYDRDPRTPRARISATRNAADTVAVALITDLLHWLAANGRDPDTVLDQAQTHFEAEVGETLDPAWPGAAVPSDAEPTGAVR
ncbi:ATP-binding protein [Streptomyces sp. NBC_01477]|uniref:ATP-binding protein n=1 Tax=Streptomyces sp. NBC_01477 TaxID=2976015 RepID=UPI002E3748CA|nr:ATP-binding protein [Streptomyces sp. NBC_01477]